MVITIQFPCEQEYLQVFPGGTMDIGMADREEDYHAYLPTVDFTAAYRLLLIGVERLW